MKQLETGSESALYEISLDAAILKDFEHQTPIRAIIRAEPELVDQADTEADTGFPFDCSIGYAVIGKRAEIDTLFDTVLDYMKGTLDDEFVSDELADEAVNNLFMFQFENIDLFCLVVGGYTQELPDKLEAILTTSGLEALQIGAWADDLDVFGVLFRRQGVDIFSLKTTHDPKRVENFQAKLSAFEPEDE